MTKVVNVEANEMLATFTTERTTGADHLPSA